MNLIDTSVWIAHFRVHDARKVEDIVPFDSIVTCLPVIQEVLQGARDEFAYRRIAEAMYALPIVEAPLGEVVFHEAIALYRTARRNGITIRSSVDCLIAACAIRNDLEVVHDDDDFGGLAKV